MDLTYQISVERKKRLVQCLGGLAAVLKGSLSADALQIWEHLLRPYPVDVIEVASLRLAQTLQFMPVPSEVIEACKVEVSRRELASLRARSNVDQLISAARQTPAELSDGRDQVGVPPRLLAGLGGAAALARTMRATAGMDAEARNRREAELRDQAVQMRREAENAKTEV